MQEITFQVDTRLAKLLSQNYRSSEKAIKELIDNAWDADADTINIQIPTALSLAPIVIEDNGSGMTIEELTREYLFIASDRRKRRGELTPLKKRKVKGKKGIGKFAGLMAASTMKLETWARGIKAEFTLQSNNFENSLDIEKLPINLIQDTCSPELHGTTITLSNLNQGMVFPSVERMRQLLLQEYGREDGFQIYINEKLLEIDDLIGNYKEYHAVLPKAGNITLKMAISDSKEKLRLPGISIRVSGKIVGKPNFFGLDKVEDFPTKLLSKIYGEIEVDGLLEHVTADWGALVENSDLFEEVKQYIQPVIREKIKEEFSREINLAQARLQRQIHQRLAELPEYKRIYADKAIKSVLSKYYGEPESKLESIVTVLLNALERSEYRCILDYIYDATHTEIGKIAEVLEEFGLAELALIAENAKARLGFLEALERLCCNDKTKEEEIHRALERNLWIFGAEFSVFSSNITLRRQIENVLNKKYAGNRATKRPDLMLNANFNNQYLLIEFKRPSHSLSFKDYQQATAYRNDFTPYTDNDITIFLIGGKRGNDLPLSSISERNFKIYI